MGSIIIWIIGILLIVLGILGCFVHRVPGPILTFLGILEIQFIGKVELLSTEAMVICAVVIVLAKILERYLPKVASCIHEVSKTGKWGCIIGSLIGLLVISRVPTDETYLMILWLIVCFGIIPFGITFLFEIMKKQPMHGTLMATTATYLTFLMGTVLKLGVCIYCIYAIIENLQA